MKNAIERQQARKNAEYASVYRQWIASVDDQTKRKAKEMGVLEPDTSYLVSKGGSDDEILERMPAPEAMVEYDEMPAPGMVLTQNPMEVVRMALCDILNPRPGSSIEYEAQIVGLAIGALGMGGISHVAKLHGVCRQAVSKRVIKFCRENDLPPSVYMRSEANREVHRLSNVRKEKGVVNG